MKKLDLKIAQKKMTELLGEFDALCEKYNLQYWIESGTALGAVRHKGFIPWDDDMDVAMLREDYDKLIKLNEDNLLPEDMILQLPKTDKRAYVPWIKIRRPYNENNIDSYDQFIRMDVFPYDYYDSKKIEHKKQVRKEILFTKGTVEYSLRKLERPILKNSKLNFKIIGCCILNKIVVRKNNTDLQQYVIDSTEVIKKDKVDINNAKIGYGVECMDYGIDDSLEKYYFDPNIIFPVKKIEFEGIEVSAPADCDKYLKNVYGNYMQCPKEEDRITHYPEIFGF